MSFLPDNMLVLITCIVVLALCALIFFIVLKIALKIRSLKIKFAAMGISALYAANPFDLIPDFIPILGQIDDVGALAAFIGFAISIYSDFKKRRNNKSQL